MALRITKTQYGLVRGLRGGDPRISVFKGIPYAKPPIGDLRWAVPQKPDAFDCLDAFEYGPVPWQKPQAEWEAQNAIDCYPMSEDCLYLNVWTPAESVEERLPVVVYIYGGAFKFGAASSPIIDGEAFARKGLVFVSFNYRVGPLGYLAHPDLSAENNGISGNYGPQDQIAALKWVYDNISAFGGDPESISVMGHSAGAYGAMSMCTTPETDGIVKRALILSTAGLSPLYYNNQMDLSEAESYGKEMLRILGVNSISEARKLPADEITTKLADVKINGKNPWFPVTDGRVFPDGTITSILKGTQHKIPYLIGCTEDETGSMPGFMSACTVDAVKGFANAIFPDDPEGFMNSVDTSSADAVYRTVFNEYENDKLGAILAWQQLEKNRDGNLAYTFFFTKDAPEAGDDHHGAYHGAELALVFDTMEREARPYDGTHYDVAKSMREYFANFLKTGNPNGIGLPQWTKPVDSVYESMELGDHIGMINVPQSPNRDFIIRYMCNKAK